MDRQIAFVMLDRPVTFDLQAVVDVMRRRYPGVTAQVITNPAADGEGTSQSHLIRCGDEVVAVTNVDAPLPQDPDDEIWARATRTWPQASTVAGDHGAHVIVALFGVVENPLREARALTAVIGGLLDAVPGCSAVMWAARVVRSAAMWKQDSLAAFDSYPDYPILLWIDVTPIRGAAGLDAVTIGLSSFVDREIEFEIGRFEPTDALGKVAGLAAYLIEHGNVVSDGDTVGGSDTERIKVRHALSQRGGGMPVLRVAAEGLEPGRKQ